MQRPSARELFKYFSRGVLYLAAFFLIAGAINWFQSPSTNSMPAISSLELTSLTGEKTILTMSAEKKTIIYFFAPWCTVCKMSMDALNFFADNPRIQTIAIGLDYENIDELKQYQDKQRSTIYAGSRVLQQKFKIDRYPTVYILDNNGNTAHVMVGYTSRLSIWLRTLL